MKSFWPLLMLLTVDVMPAVPSQPSAPAGPYSREMWRREWTQSAWEDGISEGRLDIVDRGEERRWRVSYAVGQVGPSAGGAAWNEAFSPATEITLSYVVRFSPGFDWGKGGKLPGIGGGAGKTTGGRAADGYNGFSVRPMWRAEGKAEAYVYHAGQKGRYGDSFPLPKDFRLPSDEDIFVALRLRLNHPDREDGQLELSFTTKAGKQTIRRDDLTWRKTPELKANALLFETFHGGSDASWAPRRPCAAEFGKLTLNP